MLAQIDAELFPLVDIADAGLKTSLADADASARDAVTTVIERRRCRKREPGADTSEKVLFRNAATCKVQFGGHGRAEAQHSENWLDGNSWLVPLNKECANLAIALGKDQKDVGKLSVCNPLFVPVQNVAVSRQSGRRLHTIRVTAHFRFGQSESCDTLSQRKLRQPIFLLLPVA